MSLWMVAYVGLGLLTVMCLGESPSVFIVLGVSSVICCFIGTREMEE